MEKHLYKVKFKVRCYCCGVYCYADAHLSVFAESESKAIEKIKSNIAFEILNVNAIELHH